MGVLSDYYTAEVLAQKLAKANARVKRLESNFLGGWRDTKNVLPEPDRVVLTMSENGHAPSCAFVDAEGVWYARVRIVSGFFSTDADAPPTPLQNTPDFWQPIEEDLTQSKIWKKIF